jgi:ATP phosphoribosyltransferase regulatory subunit
VKGILENSLRRYELKKQLDTFALENGFLPITPDLFEQYEQFSESNKNLQKDELVIVMNGRQQVYFLRPDITSAIMRQVKNYYEKDSIVKLFYQSSVYRSDDYKILEIPQFGVESIGGGSETEILNLASMILSNKEIPYIIELSNSHILNSLIAQLEIPNVYMNQVKTLIATKNHDGLLSLGKKLEVNENSLNLIDVLFNLRGTYRDVLAKLEPYLITEKISKEFNSLEKLQSSIPNSIIDLTMVNNFEYYDGLIFKGYYSNLPNEVLSGGCYTAFYDESNDKVNAVGFSLDIEGWLKEREV